MHFADLLCLDRVDESSQQSKHRLCVASFSQETANVVEIEIRYSKYRR